RADGIRAPASDPAADAVPRATADVREALAVPRDLERRGADARRPAASSAPRRRGALAARRLRFSRHLRRATGERRPAAVHPEARRVEAEDVPGAPRQPEEGIR